MLCLAVKKCTSCKVVKPTSEFQDNKDGRLGKYSKCSGCEAERYKEERDKRLAKAKASYHKNPERARNRGLKKRYGITLTEFDSLLASQGHKCAMCGTSEPGGMGTFHVDHCHRTGKIRALLCTKCNVGLGALGDDPARASEMLYRYASLVSQEQVIEEQY